MAIQQLVSAKRVLQRTLSSKCRGRRSSSIISNNFVGDYSKMSVEVPRGHFTVYVGRTGKKRMVIPVSYLNHPLFQKLLHEVEEEFGYEHPMGGITIPCTEDYFLALISMIDSY